MLGQALKANSTRPYWKTYSLPVCFLGIAPTDGLEDGPPEKNLRDDWQETHERPKGKVTAIGQPFLQRNTEDHPPTGNFGHHWILSCSRHY